MDESERWAWTVKGRVESTEDEKGLWAQWSALQHNNLSVHAHSHCAGVSCCGAYTAQRLPVPTCRKDSALLQEKEKQKIVLENAQLCLSLSLLL